MYYTKQIGNEWAIVNSLGTVLKMFPTESDAKAYIDYVSN